MARRPSLPALPFLQFFPTQTLFLLGLKTLFQGRAVACCSASLPSGPPRTSQMHVVAVTSLGGASLGVWASSQQLNCPAGSGSSSSSETYIDLPLKQQQQQQQRFFVDKAGDGHVQQRFPPGAATAAAALGTGLELGAVARLRSVTSRKRGQLVDEGTRPAGKAPAVGAATVSKSVVTRALCAPCSRRGGGVGSDAAVLSLHRALWSSAEQGECPPLATQTTTVNPG